MGVYRRADSKTYWMALMINGQRVRHGTAVQDRKVAEEIFAAWQVQVARERWLGIPPPTPKRAVRDLLAEYAATVTPRKSPHSQRRDRILRARFTRRWGTTPLEELGSKVLEDYLAERLTAVTFATASKELGLLKSAYTRAVRWGWVPASPFRGLALNQEGEARLRWLTDDEEVRLLAACAPRVRDIVIVGVDTGLRRSNLVGLQWSWIQEQGTVLIVPRQHLKAKKVTVWIPLTTRAAAIIDRQVRRLDGPAVFTQPDGTAYAADQVGVAVVRAAKRAGLEGVSLHTLRHTFISRLVQAGRPLPEVAAPAGHRDIKMTMRYAHLAPSHLRAGIQALEQSRRGGNGVAPA